MDKRVLFISGALILASFRVWRCRRQGIGFGAALGLRVDARALPEFAAGAAISICTLVAVFLLAAPLGLLTILGFGSVASLANVSTPLIVGFVEEFVFRSALLGALLSIAAPRAAIVLSALAFSAVHLSNQGINELALICTFIGGLVYGFAFIGSKRLWLPTGLHFGWNYAEGRLLGFAVSGGTVSESFVRQHDNGPALWTGGAYGPEGGLLGIAAKVLAFALLFVLLRFATQHASAQGRYHKYDAANSGGPGVSPTI